MLLDELEGLFHSSSVEEVWGRLTAYMERFGFDRLIYGFTRFRTANSFGDMNDLLVLSSHGEDYIRPFIDEGLFFHAPMVRWATENEGACSWSWIAEQSRAGGFTKAEQRVVDFNVAHRVTAGYSISFKDVSRRAKGALGLTARAGTSQEEVDKIWGEHGREIQVVANTAHLKLISLPYTGMRRPLTPRQREVLEWVGDGKTTQDIALILGVSPATVEKHLRLAREALNVETTAQAVLKASYQNQIFLFET